MIPLLVVSVILSSITGGTLMTATATGCGSHKRDVLIMVDNSSMNRTEFGFLKQALADVVDTFTINPDNIQVTVITYPFVEIMLWLMYLTHKSDLKTSILNLKPNSRNLPLSPDGAFASGKYYVFGGVDRADASNVVLLFAGNELYLTEEDFSISNFLKEEDKVEWYCLGVKNANVSQLNQLASLPSSDHVFFSDSYSDLGALVPQLAQIACDHCSMTPCQGNQICDLSTNTCINQTTQGAPCPSYSTIKQWCADFKRGRRSTEDEPRPGRPCEVTTEENVNAVLDTTYKTVPAPRKDCPMNFYERHAYRISGCPVIVTTFAESSIVCAVHCRPTEGCTNFNMAREADILNNCQLVTCTDTDMLTVSGDHDFYTPTCFP